jgi:arylsulfatase A-like enzyme
LPYPRTEADVRKAMALYYGMMSQLDSQIGRILAALDEQGLADNTLVLFVGDHGHSLGSHGFVGKQCMYDEGIRMPLIMRYPPIRRGSSTCDALVSLVDFFPTICQAAAIEPPAGVEGHSLLPLYAGEQPAVREHLFASHHSPGKHGMSTCCVRTKQHKLIQHLTTGETEFFDLANDPFELTNLSGKPQVAEIQSKLTAELNDWRSTRLDRASNTKQRTTE